MADPQPDSAPRSSALWYRRFEQLPSGLWLAEAREGDAQLDGSVHDASQVEGVGRVVWRTARTERGILRIDAPESRIPDAPDLWFVEVDEPRAQPAGACNLVAFATDAYEPGTVISRFAFAGLGIPNDRQAGAVRWHRHGLVHQIFVADGMRRRFVATAILRAADAWQQAHGWPGKVHGDGRRTELGQQFVAALEFPQRYADLTETMPPMDPGARG